ncbi:hypothetical protein M5689_005646 [Euphorbia peplus]|nr:hypothetical protein M5689_005646 [Euphorbia peplus]
MTKTASSNSMKDKTFSGIGNLVKLLPTGTLFIFQYLNPVLTNNGQCSTVHKYLSGILIGLCGFSCAFSTFTDSYVGSDGKIHYGIATSKGLWPSSNSGDMSSYKLKLGDFAHSILTVIVFAVLSLLDTNTVRCFYPSFESTEKTLLMILPPAIGVISGTVFMIFPNKRHGIGYPSNESSKDS